MWAFAIWDKQKKELFCSRDRFGIKPLYWYMNSDFFYFSSEIKQLRAIGIGKKCNYDEISIYLYTGCANSSKIDKLHNNSLLRNYLKIFFIHWYTNFLVKG